MTFSELYNLINESQDIETVRPLIIKTINNYFYALKAMLDKGGYFRLTGEDGRSNIGIHKDDSLNRIPPSSSQKPHNFLAFFECHFVYNGARSIMVEVGLPVRIKNGNYTDFETDSLTINVYERDNSFLISNFRPGPLTDYEDFDEEDAEIAKLYNSGQIPRLLDSNWEKGTLFDSRGNWDFDNDPYPDLYKYKPVVRTPTEFVSYIKSVLDDDDRANEKTPTLGSPKGKAKSIPISKNNTNKNEIMKSSKMAFV